MQSKKTTPTVDYGYVPGYGPVQNKLMLVGEYPGKEEVNRGRPFAGNSGSEQDWYFDIANNLDPGRPRIRSRHFYMSNIIKEGLGSREKTPALTTQLVSKWHSEMLDEVAVCKPRLVVAVGKIAAEWFLGVECGQGKNSYPSSTGTADDLQDIDTQIINSIVQGTVTDGSGDEADSDTSSASSARFDLESYHGRIFRPCSLGNYNSDLANLIDLLDLDFFVMAVYHPAFGFYKDSMKSMILQDYRRVTEVARLILNSIDTDTDTDTDTDSASASSNTSNTYYVNESIQSSKYCAAIDTLAGKASYLHMSASEAATYLYEWFTAASTNTNTNIDVRNFEPMFSLDTEDDNFTVQISTKPGEGIVVLCEDPEFSEFLSVLKYVLDRGATVAMHYAIHDLLFLQDHGYLDVVNMNIHVFDTMYGAYLLGEPQSLKTFCRRHLGMSMEDYLNTIAVSNNSVQLDYLIRASEIEWPQSETEVIRENNGTWKVYTPMQLNTRLSKILKEHLHASLGIVKKKKKRKNSNSSNTDTDSDSDSKGAQVRTLQKMYFDIPYKQRRLIESVLGKWQTTSLRDIPFDRAVEYAGKDPDATLRAALLQKEMLRSYLPGRDLYELMRRGMRTLPSLYEIAYNGFPADREHFQTLAEELQEQMIYKQMEMSQKYFRGRPFNPGSPNDVRKLLHLRGLSSQCLKRTKKGEVSTSKASIQHLSYSDDAIREMFEWRTLEHVKAAFAVPILRRMSETETTASDSDTDTAHGRIYSVRYKIKYTRTATRRLAGEKPNLLNLPTRSAIGNRIRSGFVALPGYVVGSCDQSQIEMCVIADHSRDRQLCKIIIDNGDIHSETAAKIFGIPLAQVDKKTQRTPAKTAGFGILYGISGAGLQVQLSMLGLDWTVQECTDIISEWLRIYKGVADYIRRVEQETLRLGYSCDWVGMSRELPNIYSRQSSLSAEAARVAVSQRIQGGAQSMMQNGMAWLQPRLRKLRRQGIDVRLLAQVHDELILMFKPEHEQIIKDVAVEAITKHCGIDLVVPIRAGWSIGHSWGDLK